MLRDEQHWRFEVAAAFNGTETRGGAAVLKPRSITVILLLALVLPTIGCDSSNDVSPDAVTVNGTEITDRQRDMLDIVDEYVAAWSATDGDAVASFMSPDAYVEYPERNEVFLVSDGTLQERVANGPYATLQAHAPALVYGDRVVLMGRIDALDLDWLSVIRFTASDPPLIVSETLFL